MVITTQRSLYLQYRYQLRSSLAKAGMQVGQSLDGSGNFSAFSLSLLCLFIRRMNSSELDIRRKTNTFVFLPLQQLAKGWTSPAESG